MLLPHKCMGIFLPQMLSKTRNSYLKVKFQQFNHEYLSIYQTYATSLILINMMHNVSNTFVLLLTVTTLNILHVTKNTYFY